MIEFEVKKLWKGHLISLRDHIVNKGIREGGITVKHESQKMFLSPEVLRNGTGETKEIASKYKEGQKYNLVDFRWNPDDESQEELPF
tara:strand:+ start:3807 stop:4067 length:261 start_codon:yes stop_codon:yes gene_type:complete